ncbi:MAG: gfo/Idh/MocA family oxidoreductase, partial [Planctomycetota bacterium]
HLFAYRKARYPVVALCDVDRGRAESRRREFYPQADVHTDYRDVLARDDIEVVDVTPHPLQRAPILEAALRAGKHVLSQKPFVLDLDFGRRLVRLAQRRGLRLAVNQNGRWAPHFAYIREAVHRGLIGEVVSVHMSMHWDHNWVRDFPFNRIRHLILFDFAIHWFDMLHCLMRGRKARRVYASYAKSPGQTARPKLLAQAAVEYADAQATLVFDGDVRIGGQDRVFVGGTRGSIWSLGFHEQRRCPKVTLTTERGACSPRLRGHWFPDGFHGTMGELLCAIEQRREPSHNARENLGSLALCFAAVESAETHAAVTPGSCTKLRPGSVL